MWVYLPTSVYSAGPAGSISEQNSSEDSAPSATSSGTTTPKPSSCPECGTEDSTRLLCGTTCRPLMESRGKGVLMSFLAGFPANRTALRQRTDDSEKKTKETFGRNTCGLCERYNLLTSSDRMYLESSLMGIPSKSWQTLNQSVTAPRLAPSELVMLVPHSKEKGSFSLPTPTASDGMAFGKKLRKESIEKSLTRGATIRQWYILKLADLEDSLFPIYAEWSMGWKTLWTVLDSAAMEWFRSNQPRHGK